jgi:hypothetical protein
VRKDTARFGLLSRPKETEEEQDSDNGQDVLDFKEEEEKKEVYVEAQPKSLGAKETRLTLGKGAA